MKKDYPTHKELVKESNKKLFKGCLTFILIIIVLLGWLVYHFFYSMNSLPKGEFINQFESPTGAYVINIYRSDGGATTSYAIRGELVTTKTNKQKNIYWEYHVENAEVSWESDHVVMINGKKLDVRKDTYDYRRHE
ncbi:MAG: DUF5412 domain-containing protein [Bacillaceae bacterium]